MSVTVCDIQTVARVKVLHPMLTAGPSMHAEIISRAESQLTIRVPRLIVYGSTVQVRSGKEVMFGKVYASVVIGSDCEIAVNVERSS